MTAGIVSVQVVQPRNLAAVRRMVRLGSVGQAWKPALDLVWAHLRSQPGLWKDGHNLFLYHHPAHRDTPMAVEFGVEVTRSFEPAGEVQPAQTPKGEAAVAIHRGAYSELRRTHDAIHAWAADHRRRFAGWSWEIYGHWSDDPRRLETTVVYLLEPASAGRVP